MTCEEEWQGVIPWIDGLLVRVSGGSGPCSGLIGVGYHLPEEKELLFSVDFVGQQDIRLDLSDIETQEAAVWAIRFNTPAECDLDVYEIGFTGTCPVWCNPVTSYVPCCMLCIL
jgi:hypothetical protein